jgi:molybdate transport system substrate-binding protein
MPRLPVLLLALLPALAAGRPAPGGALAVAAASNLKLAADELRRGFEQAHPGAKVNVTLGASGTLVAQIRNGAPFDLFLSADRDDPRRLVQEGLTAGPEVIYAVGRLVVWTRAGSRLPLERDGLRALAGPGVGKVAMPNPSVAPYGRAAEAALRAAGVWEAVRRRLVLGQNVSQTAQFAASGAADAALIPLSLTYAPELREGRAFHVPPATYPPQVQAAVILRGARDPAIAREFLAYVTGTAGRVVLRRYGYELP